MNKPNSLNVYLERRASRTYVGRLTKKEGGFVFEYDKSYAYADNSIPIGPELPITKRIHKSENLFSSFVDRIPSRKNPAYVEYCAKFGIPINEKDEIILLSTIGQRGPSSFIFEKENDMAYSNFDYLSFRKDLQLTTRDFATVFNLSLTTLNRIERGASESGRELLKRIEIYDKFPQVALFELHRRKELIHSVKYTNLEKMLVQKVSYLKSRKASALEPATK
jgi:HipA-like protein